MEYGILVAVSEDGGFQIVGAVSSRDEAKELAANYMSIRLATNWIAPWEFQIHRRGTHGGYTVVDHLGFAEQWEPNFI